MLFNSNITKTSKFSIKKGKKKKEEEVVKEDIDSYLMKMPLNEDPKKPFRIFSNFMFLTYPQCGLELQYVKEYFNKAILKCYKYVIVRELHKSGDPHLHIVFDFGHKRYDMRGLDKFEIVDNNNNNIESRIYKGHYIGSVKAASVVYRYVNKSYEEILTNMTEEDIEYQIRQADYQCRNKSTWSTRMMTQQNNLDLINNSDCLTMSILNGSKSIVSYKTMKENVLLYKEDIERQFYLKSKEEVGHKNIKIENNWNQRIMIHKRERKRRHIYIFGPNNTGKTYWVKNVINKRFKSGNYVNGASFQHGLDVEHDFIIFEDLSKPNPLVKKETSLIEDILAFSDGNYEINKKHKEHKKFIRPPYMIITSNYSMKTLFGYDKVVMNQMEIRFKQYVLNEHDIFDLTDVDSD